VLDEVESSHVWRYAGFYFSFVSQTFVPILASSFHFYCFCITFTIHFIVVRSDCVAILQRLCSDCAAISQGLRSDCVAISHRLCSDCAAISQGLRGDCVALSQRLCSDCVANSQGLRSDCVAISQGWEQWQINCTVTAICGAAIVQRLHGDCRAMARRL
jgi:hypothetical protein